MPEANAMFREHSQENITQAARIISSQIVIRHSELRRFILLDDRQHNVHQKAIIEKAYSEAAKLEQAAFSQGKRYKIRFVRIYSNENDGMDSLEAQMVRGELALTLILCYLSRQPVPDPVQLFK